jgi:hypothetical protein
LSTHKSKINHRLQKIQKNIQKTARFIGRELILARLIYSFPWQLLLYNFKKNQFILLLWLVLLGIVTENVATMFGLPSLLLDPEYNYRVDFWSCFIVGFTWGIFTMSFHIICYILDGPKFTFCGSLRSPFTKFFINNNLIPLIITGVYVYNLIIFQSSNEKNDFYDVVERAGGLVTGMVVSATLLFLYFVNTNQDIFRFLASRVEKRLKRTRIARVNVLNRIQTTRNSKVRVDYYLDNFLRLRKVNKLKELDYPDILHIFDQNHLNAVIIQLAIFVTVLAIGTMRDYPAFQIPAGASVILLFTIFLMLAGALNYWLRGWAFTITLLLILVLNYVMREHLIIARYEAYGLNYETNKAEYSLKRVKEMGNDSLYRHDYQYTLLALENWKQKHLKINPSKKPKMVFVCISGGGQRAAVWAMRTLQIADQSLQGSLMKHTMLITGASGGLVGAGYFRELCLRKELFLRGEGLENINPYEEKYLDNIAKDNLNAIAFSLVVNDIFLGFQTFDYAGQTYYKDRGFAFEQQLNRNTGGILDKPLCDYKEPELWSYIPMMILSPTVVNDGRKLFISPLYTSYMTVPKIDQTRFLNQKTKGIEFLRFFEEQNASDLRFLSALRMSATFPYVTPNVKLPSTPEMEIMDAGLSDNFGVSDAVRFLYTFRNWIAQNTSGVVFVSIRDTQKDKPIEKSLEQSLFQRIFTPVTSFFGNLEYLQDISNDNMIEFAQGWFPKGFGVHRVEFQYVPLSQSWQELQEKIKHPETHKDPYRIVRIQRAPLSWRLTEKEKESIKRTIYELRNQYSIKHLRKLLK